MFAGVGWGEAAVSQLQPFRALKIGCLKAKNRTNVLTQVSSDALLKVTSDQRYIAFWPAAFDMSATQLYHEFADSH